jgi:hypothetical protein
MLTNEPYSRTRRILVCPKLDAYFYVLYSAFVRIRQHSMRRVGTSSVGFGEPYSTVQHTSAYVSIHQHTSAYVSIHLIRRLRRTIFYSAVLFTIYVLECLLVFRAPFHARRAVLPAYVSIRQHASAYVSIRQPLVFRAPLHARRAVLPAYVSIRQDSIRQHTSAYVSIRQHTSAYVSIRQHTSAYVPPKTLNPPTKGLPPILLGHTLLLVPLWHTTEDAYRLGHTLEASIGTTRVTTLPLN